jgi:hypothetical protein
MSDKKTKQREMQEALAKRMEEQKKKLLEKESQVESLGEKKDGETRSTTPEPEVVVNPEVHKEKSVEPIVTKETVKEPEQKPAVVEPAKEIKEIAVQKHNPEVKEVVETTHEEEVHEPVIRVGQGLLDGFVEFLNELSVTKTANNSVYLDDDANKVLEDLQVAFKHFTSSKKAVEKKVILSKIVIWFAKSHKEELGKMRKKAERKNSIF